MAAQSKRAPVSLHWLELRSSQETGNGPLVRSGVGGGGDVWMDGCSKRKDKESSDSIVFPKYVWKMLPLIKN